MKVETRRFSNGLQAAVIPLLGGSSFVSIALAVRAGSRYESAVQNGISHFLEHMLFRGSKRYPSSFSLNHAIEALGDGLEGGTGRESTLYSVEFPAAHVDSILAILGDLFRNPVLTDIETEKGIIFEEMLDELDENGQEADLSNISRKLIFGSHSLGQPVLGRQESLNRITSADVHAQFREFYQPDNMTIAAAGSLDPEKFFEQVSQVFGTEVGGAVSKSIQPIPPPSKPAGPAIHFLDKAGSQTEVLISFMTEGERSPGFLAQMVLERILDDGLSSRLQRALCERKGLLYEVGASLETYTDVCVFDLNFKVAEEKLQDAVDGIFRELQELKLKPLDAEELSKVKARLEREALALFESPRSLALRVAETLLLKTETPITFEGWQAAIRGLTAQEIQSVAQRVFVPERMVAVIQGKFREPERKKIREALLSLS